MNTGQLPKMNKKYSTNESIVIHHIQGPGDLIEISRFLDLAQSAPVLVLIGGAGGVTEQQMQAIRKAIQVVAQVADRAKAIVVDGGTDSGVMAAMGQTRKQEGFDFPLVGVAVEKLVTWPGGPNSALLDQERVPLEPNHTHFVLVPGEDWGDESALISEAASHLAGENLSATVLLNGGTISRQDMAHSLEANRPVVVVQGTGRLADELAANPPESQLVQIVAANDEEQLAQTLSQLLIGS